MLLLETQYLPSIAWCSAVWQEKLVALDAAEHYQKGSLRNRCHIAGPNGPQRLSIPLIKGKHQQTPIRGVRISYEIPWQRQHWRTIKTVYGNAPFLNIMPMISACFTNAVGNFYLITILIFKHLS
ncbi:MAG: WbqC family protein [Lewinellaceae bacterium]|nr:WbqC family protein [Lewinellaceae bacterium]